MPRIKQKSPKEKGYHQMSFYIRPQLLEGLNQIREKYPMVTDSAWINAAVEFYLPYAQRGVDGNLLPFTLQGNGGAAQLDLLRDTIREVVREVTGAAPAETPSCPPSGLSTGKL